MLVSATAIGVPFRGVVGPGRAELVCVPFRRVSVEGTVLEVVVSAASTPLVAVAGRPGRRGKVKTEGVFPVSAALDVSKDSFRSTSVALRSRRISPRSAPRVAVGGMGTEGWFPN